MGRNKKEHRYKSKAWLIENKAELLQIIVPIASLERLTEIQNGNIVWEEFSPREFQTLLLTKLGTHKAAKRLIEIILK